MVQTDDRSFFQNQGLFEAYSVVCKDWFSSDTQRKICAKIFRIILLKKNCKKSGQISTGTITLL